MDSCLAELLCRCFVRRFFDAFGHLFKQFVAVLFGTEHAWLKLHHARVQLRINCPDAVFVQMLHGGHTALLTFEFQAHNQSVLANAEEVIRIVRFDFFQSVAQILGQEFYILLGFRTLENFKYF